MSARRKAHTIALAIASTTLLAGCLATMDWAADDAPVNQFHRQEAKNMLSMLRQYCVKVRTLNDVETGEKVKLAGHGSVRRMCNSDSAWLKAEIVSQGMWDSVYHNRRTGEFVCGQKSWDKRADAAKYSFNEIQPIKTAPDWN